MDRKTYSSSDDVQCYRRLLLSNLYGFISQCPLFIHTYRMCVVLVVLRLSIISNMGTRELIPQVQTIDNEVFI